MALKTRQYHVLRSWLFVLLFLFAIIVGFFMLVGMTTDPFYKAEGKVELPASYVDVRRALLDVNQFPILRPDMESLRIVDSDKNGARIWEATMPFDKHTRFVRQKEQFLDRIVVFQDSPARNTRSVLNYHIEPLGVNKTRVVITEERHVPQWFNRSLLVFYGIDANLRNELSYLRSYFGSSFAS